MPRASAFASLECAEHDLRHPAGEGRWIGQRFALNDEGLIEEQVCGFGNIHASLRLLRQKLDERVVGVDFQDGFGAGLVFLVDFQDALHVHVYAVVRGDEANG